MGRQHSNIARCRRRSSSATPSRSLQAGSFVSTKVTTGVDTTYDYTMKAFEGVKQNKYTTMVTRSITAFEKDVVSKAKPYAPKLALAAAVAVTIPMLFMFFFMS